MSFDWRRFLTSTFAITYLGMASMLFVLGLHHDLATSEGAAQHSAFDICTWVKHTAGSTLLTDRAVEVVILES